jgi:anti-sigma B factor antagonist
LTVTSSRQDGAVVVGLTGELDMMTVEPARTALREAIEVGAPVVVLDLTGLQFFASAGLNLLLQLHDGARERQLDVRVAGDHRIVTRPMELTGLTELFPVYPSVAVALAASGSPPG